MNVLITLLRLLISIPLCVIWMAMLGMITIGWGVTAADEFIKSWGTFVDKGPFTIGEDNE